MMTAPQKSPPFFLFLSFFLCIFFSFWGLYPPNVSSLFLVYSSSKKTFTEMTRRGGVKVSPKAAKNSPSIQSPPWFCTLRSAGFVPWWLGRPLVLVDTRLCRPSNSFKSTDQHVYIPGEDTQNNRRKYNTRRRYSSVDIDVESRREMVETKKTTTETFSFSYSHSCFYNIFSLGKLRKMTNALFVKWSKKWPISICIGWFG